MIPQVIQCPGLDLQVCVPKDWTDKQVIDFAELKCQSGTTNGWSIRRQGDERLAGDNERTTCAEDKDYVHIVLEV